MITVDPFQLNYSTLWMCMEVHRGEDGEFLGLLSGFVQQPLVLGAFVPSMVNKSPEEFSRTLISSQWTVCTFYSARWQQGCSIPSHQGPPEGWWTQGDEHIRLSPALSNSDILPRYKFKGWGIPCMGQ